MFEMKILCYDVYMFVVFTLEWAEISVFLYLDLIVSFESDFHC